MIVIYNGIISSLKNMNTGKNSVWKDYEKNEITHSVTHYLFAIDSLHRDKWYVRAVDIAKKLDITPGSCSVWIKWLLKKEFILEDENKMICLSQTWKDAVIRISSTRQLFEKFFIDKLWSSKWLATRNACKIEHLIDEELTKLMSKYLEK